MVYYLPDKWRYTTLVFLLQRPTRVDLSIYLLFIERNVQFVRQIANDESILRVNYK